MPQNLDLTQPQTWLTRAKSNLRLARIGHQEGVFSEDLCFEAQADTLTQYAVAGRYPGWLSVTEEEYQQAVTLAELIVTWVENIIKGEAS